MSPRKQFRLPPTWRVHPVLTFMLVIGLGILAFTLIALTTPAQAAPAQQGEKRSDEFCLTCHQDKKLKTTIGTDQLSLAIDPVEFQRSAHGTGGIGCVDCHTNINNFPHPEVTARSTREFSLQLYTLCQQCHNEQYQKTLDSVHEKALAAGNTNAAICTDCHNPHTQQRLTGKTSGELTPSARVAIPKTCAKCHSTIYDTYKNSVHGNALLQEGNTDVPTCIDCHGVHNISNPTTVTFRNSVPFLCAKCHTNHKIMDKYGISTDVLNTYVADFHGKTVMLFEAQFPGQPTNKPVCTDCHGFHDIALVTNPQTGIALRQNLLVKCQRCHPDATANFPDAWMSHYEPSPQHYALVYYVNLFYKIFIPTVLGGMILFVLSDIYRRIINKIKGGKKA